MLLWLAQNCFLMVIIIAMVFFFIYHVGFTSRRNKLRENLPAIAKGPPVRYVTVSFWGRLGNHMFEYATMIGFAEHHNKTPILVEGTELWNAFKLPVSKGSKTSLGLCKIYHEDLPAAYSKQIEEFFPFDSYLQGYFQSYKYFEFVKKKIVANHFQFHDEIQKKAEEYINNVVREKNKNGSHIVGIHVRRGDFVRQKRKGYTAAPIPYIYRAMQYFRAKYKNVLFIICSNDQIWCKDHLDDAEDVQYSDNTDGYLDLAILVNCHHMIMTAGSYSWWAGYLSKGEVIYYKGFPQDNTVMGNKTVKADYYPPYWIGM